MEKLKAFYAHLESDHPELFNKALNEIKKIRNF
jgi:hypothetical protein